MLYVVTEVNRTGLVQSLLVNVVTDVNRNPLAI